MEEQKKLEEERESKKIKNSKNLSIAKRKNEKTDKPDQSSEQPSRLDDHTVKVKLRAKGLPVTLFGESGEERLLRLQKEESVEQKPKPVTFKYLLEKTERELDESSLLQSDLVEASTTKILEDIDTRGISVDLVKNDLDAACNLLHAFYQRLLKEWDLHLNSRPEEWKRSPPGKLQTITYGQTVEHLKLFWRGLEKRALASDILERLAAIAQHLQNREYMLANDTYIRLSIGNAPWPIGVTSSGIHERASDDRIKTSEVAHVLNDEATRKWIQGIKRLMTFAELVIY